MNANEAADSKRVIACKAIRDKAYSEAHAIRALAINDAIVVAKDEYIVAATAAASAAAVAAAAAAAAAAATAAAAAATAAAALVEVNKVNAANNQALYRARYLADHAYAHADTIYKASIEKADADYEANLLVQ